MVVKRNTVAFAAGGEVGWTVALGAVDFACAVPAGQFQIGHVESVVRHGLLQHAPVEPRVVGDQQPPMQAPPDFAR